MDSTTGLLTLKANVIQNYYGSGWLRQDDDTEVDVNDRLTHRAHAIGQK